MDMDEAAPRSEPSDKSPARFLKLGGCLLPLLAIAVLLGSLIFGERLLQWLLPEWSVSWQNPMPFSLGVGLALALCLAALFLFVHQFVQHNTVGRRGGGCRNPLVISGLGFLGVVSGFLIVYGVLGRPVPGRHRAPGRRVVARPVWPQETEVRQHQRHCEGGVRFASHRHHAGHQRTVGRLGRSGGCHRKQDLGAIPWWAGLRGAQWSCPDWAERSLRGGSQEKPR